MMKYEDGYSDGRLSDLSATLFTVALFGFFFAIGGIIGMAIFA